MGLAIFSSIAYSTRNYIKPYLFPEKTLSTQTIFITKDGHVDHSKTVEKLFINDKKCTLNEWQSYENYCDELINEVSHNPEKYSNYDAVIIKNRMTNEELVIYSLFGKAYLDRNPNV